MSHYVILTQNDSSKKYMSNIGYFIATEDKSMNKTNKYTCLRGAEREQ